MMKSPTFPACGCERIRTAICAISGAGLLALFSPGALAGDFESIDVAINGSFDKTTEPWTGQKLDAKGYVKAPEMISLETKDLPEKAAGALRLTINRLEGFNYPSHAAGAMCPLSEHIPADRNAAISFWAKSLSGANVLSIFRGGGGGSATVALDSGWKKYDIAFNAKDHPVNALVFGLISKDAPGIQQLADGECLLTGIKVLADLPKITAADYKYGPHERQAFDFWRAPGAEAAPVLVFVHGGGWLGSDKNQYHGFRATVDSLHRRGISVANVNYRFSSDAPLPAPVYDAARAIQTLRAKATEWGIDKNRIAATGDSAGGCTVLWLATHDDLADPKAGDPVARESTRLCGAAAEGAQTTIDPVVIRKDVYETALAHQMICRAAGFPDNKAMDAGYEKAAALYKEFSPINHLSADDPPIWLGYQGPVTDPAEGIHSSMFGVIFKKRADEVGAKCFLTVNRNPEMFPKAPDKWTFIYDVLGTAPDKSKGK